MQSKININHQWFEANSSHRHSRQTVSRSGIFAVSSQIILWYPDARKTHLCLWPKLWNYCLPHMVLNHFVHNNHNPPLHILDATTMECIAYFGCYYHTVHCILFTWTRTYPEALYWLSILPLQRQIGRAHVWTPVTQWSRMPSSAWKKKPTTPPPPTTIKQWSVPPVNIHISWFALTWHLVLVLD